MSLTLTREALSNQIADDLATRNLNKGLIEGAVNGADGRIGVNEGDIATLESDLGLVEIDIATKESIANVNTLKGTGWTNQTVKGNADAISTKTSKSEIAYDDNTSSFIANTLASGAIIERGSNANGEYVKFADGTLICTMYDASQSVAVNIPYESTFHSAVLVWTFPHSYINQTISLSFSIGSSGVAHGSLISTKSGRTDYRIVNAMSTLNLNASIRAIAIGRWK